VAIGNPFGLGGTVTAGIVSALHRNINAGQYDRYIQSDASINQGNSGGPMFDLAGNVIGINTALISPTGGNVGIGFAIPAEQALPIVEALRRGERPQRGYLGLAVQRLDESAASALGIPKNHGEIVQSITPGGPAARAGLQPGDVVVKINNRTVGPDESLSLIVASLQANARVPIEIIRNGQRRTVTAVVAARPTEEEVAPLTGTETEAEVREPVESQQSTSQRAARAGLGLSVQALTPEIARGLRLRDTNIRGVVVSSVDASSDAGAKGFQAGDIILSINQRPVATPEDAAAAVEAARSAGRPSVLLQVRRGNDSPRYVGVDLARR
jgi:serine protease Do